MFGQVSPQHNGDPMSHPLAWWVFVV